MGVKHGFLIVPNLTIFIHDGRTNKIIDRIETHNLVVDSGLNKIRDLIGYPFQPTSGIFTPCPKAVALDQSGNATTAGMTTLVQEVYRATLTRKIPQDKGILFQLFVGTTEANGTGSQPLRAAGLFTETVANTGTLWARAVHDLITKTSSISITYQWTFSIAAS